MTTRPAETEFDRTRDPEALEAELRRTRVELGETIDALSHKLDVKSRVTSRVSRTSTQAKAQLARRGHETHERLRQGMGHARANPAPVSAVVVAVAAAVVLGVVVWGRRS